MPQGLFVARVWKLGASTVFPLYKLLCEAIQIRKGDTLLVRVHPPYVTFRKFDAEELIPAEAFTVDELPRFPQERSKHDRGPRVVPDTDPAA